MTEEEVIQNHKTGDLFTAKIDGALASGKIFIGETSNGSIKVWLCQNVRSGNIADNLLGYSNSWRWDGGVSDCIVTHAVPPEPVVVNNYQIY